ncbi:MAG: hypothetical protein A2Z21_05445 [Candidatus Fraserbacteria bacterium RBG_16_55_9]|uniref:Haloacid dehalogenase n=1 Tax=Fraserbacteria sp. (strain RBG_16_55_9) TaxID=1817864 RepID=A0A1F5V2P0_FRAXR|nr:MAG: hypothetical protein A2Z21_05445 [Candidatus Fraserbacteria bacterium RBG_16_55_9]
MKYQAVVFDLFGTLVDQFYKAEHESLLSEMAMALAAPQRDFAYQWVGTYDQRATGAFPSLEANIEQICRSLHVNVKAAQISEAARRMLDFTRQTLLPRPDAVETLAELRVLGYKIGLISNCSSVVPDLWRETPSWALLKLACMRSSFEHPTKMPMLRVMRNGTGLRFQH